MIVCIQGRDYDSDVIIIYAWMKDYYCSIIIICVWGNDDYNNMCLKEKL